MVNDPSIPGPSCTGYSAAGLDVVYFVNAQAGDILDLTYLQLNTDTSFYIVTDCSNVSGTCVAGADQTVPPDPEVIHYVATAAGAYYIILDSYTVGSGGPWTLDYSFAVAAPEACCFSDGHCEMRLPSDCGAMGGTPQGSGTTCDTMQCTQPQACCFSDGHCEMQPVDVCRQLGGVPQGDGTTCDYVQCMVNPTERTTWGHIKSLYRDTTR